MYASDSGGSDGKASAYNAGDPGSIPGSGRSSGEGNGNPLQYPWLENPMDGGSWHCTGERDQDHPHGIEMQKSQMAVWGGLTNSCEKKRSKKQRRKGKI